MIRDYLSFICNEKPQNTETKSISYIYNMGFDFGISNMYCGIYKNENYEILTLDGLKKNLENYVYYNPQSSAVFVGEKAKDHIYEVNQCIYDFNKIIDLEYDNNEVKKLKEKFSLTNQNNIPIFNVEYFNANESLKASDFVVEILTKTYTSLKDYLKFQPQDEFCFVVSVPLFYSERQRNEVKLLFQRKFHITNITIIPDFSSTIIGYIYYNYKQNKIDKNEEIVLVYDFGESTFKVSLVKVNNESKIIKLLEKEYNMDLGGNNIDECLMNHYIYEYMCIDDREITSKQMNELKNECEKVKCLLNSKDCDCLEVNCNWLKSSGVDCLLHRNELDDLCKDIYLKTMQHTDNVIKKSHISTELISTVILVGGSSKVLKIHEMISEKLPNSKIFCDLKDEEININGCIAYGYITGYKYVIEE